MKTLKKTLCLVLAVVMAVGVLVIPASAADYDEFTDKDKIEHTEAVSVLNGMEIIDGKENNSFDPTGTLTRGEAAKLVAYSLLGKERADMLTGSESGFTDVKGHWAAKYIAYAAQLGILQGNGDGTVEPEGKLTGYALAKMLLVAAGIEGTYTGMNWENNVMIAATRVGLLDDVSITLGDEISRDDAAQLVWNAVNYAPNGETKQYIVYNDEDQDGEVDDDEAVIDTTDDATSALILAMATDADIKLEIIREGSIGRTVYGLRTEGALDAWGRDVLTYTNGKGGNDKVVYASFNANSTKSYENTGKTVDAVLSDLGYKQGGTTANVTVIEDGETSDTLNNTPVQRRAKSADNYAAMQAHLETNLGGRGALIEVFKDGNDIDIYVINTYVYKLKKADIIPYKAATANTDEVKAHVDIEGNTYETDAYAKDDIVVYTVNKSTDKIVAMAKADTVTGSVTATSSSYIRVDGEQVYISTKNSDTPVIGTTAGYTYTEDEYTYYLDFYGNAMMAVKGRAADVKTNYIYVVAFDSQAYNGGNDTLLDGVTGTKEALARVRVVDPETGIVSVKDLAIVKGNDNKYYYANPNGSRSTNEVKGSANGDTALFNIGTGKFFKYAEISDGVIALDLSANGAVTPTNVTIEKNKAQVATGSFANSSTITKAFFYDAAKKEATLNTYTGYANFPSTALTTTQGVVVANENGTVSNIYMVLNAAPVAEKTLVPLAVYMGEGEFDGTHHYSFNIGGDVYEYVNDNAVANLISDNVGAVFTLSTDDDVIITATKQNAKKTEVEVVTVENEYLVVKNGEANELVNFSKEYVIVEAEEDYAAAQVEAGDYVTLYGAVDSDGAVKDEIALVIIVPAPDAE